MKHQASDPRDLRRESSEVGPAGAAGVIWIGIDDVILAADREIVAMGPEVAGFIVLESTLRVREVGGGITDAPHLAISTSGEVALTAPTSRSDEFAATSAMRSLLRRLLDVSTATTPSLRQCARRGSPGLGALARELEGALIPLNRAATRRAIVRIAKTTIDAANEGRLEGRPPSRAREEAAPREASRAEVRARPSAKPASSGHEKSEKVAQRSAPPPVPSTHYASSTSQHANAYAASPGFDADHARARATVDDALMRAAASLPSPREMHGHVFAAPPMPRAWEETPPPLPQDRDRAEARAPSHADRFDDALTPYAASLFEPEGDAPATHDPIAEMAAKIDASRGDHGDDAFEIVTSLPPDVEASALAKSASISRVTGHSPPKGRAPDAVDALLEGFSISGRRDDKALSRDLKAMIGIDATRQPPSVAMRESAPGSITGMTATITHDGHHGDAYDGPHDSDASALLGTVTPTGATAVTRDASPSVQPAPMPARASLGRSLLAFAGAVAAVSIGAYAGMKVPHRALRGGNVTSAAAAQPAATPHATTTCAATLSLDHVPANAEVARKLGGAPQAFVVPLHVPFDLVAVSHAASGLRAARRHVDASLAWTAEATQPHAELLFALEAVTGEGLAWPARDPATTPLGAVAQTTARGTVRVTSEPSGAELWLVVDPAAIAELPCEAPVDLTIAAPASDTSSTPTMRSLRVEWSSFSGTPPRANLAL